ncbi:LysR family transcriptional regulator [Microbulbifer rhizosphaerae]|uniref:DNA-binding transcriptional LysR family regulator n=1 Tax=Microbulbifer rhizosphaerae TaxID=1562603 RepID=A0A7W4Z7W5_9GAMM|nr:LysR family transcriptional regulator [Microbulbifer rhizosphaerae]MBB3060178.1 DNA-binding transcriptional LysR family regulator [Microbulbifer rhizosphaerae]
MDTVPNLRHLAALAEAGHSGSISSAARSVHLSQSAVTQGLSGIERMLGTELFNRTTSGVFPTAAGRVYLERVERGLAWLKQLEREATGRGGQQGLRRLLTVAQLRALITVVNTGSFSHAANQLGLSQPTVQRAARELETVSGQELFRRSPFGVEPTWRARQMARYANLAFDEIRQGFDEVRSLTGGKLVASLAVGSLPLARTRMVPQAVSRLLQVYPETRVKIVDGPYDEQLHALLHAQIHMIVGALRHPLPSPDIRQEVLFDDPLYIVVRPGHPLLAKRRASARVLSQLDWIAPRERTPARKAFSHFFQREKLTPPEHVIECSSLVAIRSLLRDTDRAALLPARQVEVDVKAGLLAVMPTPLAGTTRAIGITTRNDWKPTAVQARFIELLHDFSTQRD